MEFIYTIHFLVTVFAFLSMFSKDFRVVGGVIFSLHIINYLVLAFIPDYVLTDRYGLIPYAFVMDLLVTVILLNFHRKVKDIFSLKIMVVMYLYAVAHFLNFLNLFIRWEVKTLSIYWGDLTQLVALCKIYHNAYDPIILGLTFILTILFFNSGIKGLTNAMDYIRHLFIHSRSSFGGAAFIGHDRAMDLGRNKRLEKKT